MDEDEYEGYLDSIDAIDPLLRTELDDPIMTGSLIQQLRDEDGNRVDGCYWTPPAPTI